MAVWPLYIAATLVLVLWGAMHNVWFAPLMALIGFVGVRLTMGALDPAYHEVAICTLWLIIATCLMYKGCWIPGVFFAFSALTYPLFLLIGFRIEYMGLMPMVADGFAVLALISIGGGIFGVSRPHLDTGRPVSGLAAYSVGMAQGEVTVDRNL